MKYVIAENYQSGKEGIISTIENFTEQGRLFNDGARNVIKIFPFQDMELNIKSFKIPNIVNRVAYRFVRKSKAERSYNYAHRLLEKGVGTPRPIAYAEEEKGLLFGRSFYVSEHLKCDLTFRTLVQEPDYPEREKILRAFTRFTFSLHEKEVEFLDHSPGNTLIALNNGNYSFYLVDLNRMNFRPLDFDSRMRNFSRLTPERAMVEVMADEYAKLSNKSQTQVFEAMWSHTQTFQEKFLRKRRLKKKLKFWKK